MGTPLPCGCASNVRTMGTMVRQGRYGAGHYAQDGDYMGPCASFPLPVQLPDAEGWVHMRHHQEELERVRKEVDALKFKLEEDYQDRLRRINVLAIQAHSDPGRMVTAFTFEVGPEMLYTVQRRDLIPDLVGRAADQFAEFLLTMRRHGSFPAR